MEQAIGHLLTNNSLARKLILCFSSELLDGCSDCVLSIISQESSTPSLLWCHSRRSSKKQTENQKRCSKVKITFRSYGSLNFASKILGQTFDAVFVTDLRGAHLNSHPFANTLAQSVECVKRGGVVLVQFHSKSVYTERLKQIALTRSGSCVVVDDTIEQKIECLTDVRKHRKPKDDNECATKEQAKVLKAIISNLMIEEKNRDIQFIGAGRGRGKSALLGIAIGRLIANQASKNRFIVLCGPSLLATKTVFEFLMKTLTSESIPFKSETTINSEVSSVRVDNDGNQSFIEYLNPLRPTRMSCDLLVIDEAASLPVTNLQPLINITGISCPILMATTTNGYEGTGNTFSLRLLSQIESTGRVVIRHVIHEPIRYAENDPVELWLSEAVLCSPMISLDDQNDHEERLSSYPIPNETEFAYLNKSVAFNGSHDRLIFSIMKIFIQSHYRHSPNDIELMADLKTHHIFLLMKRNNANEIFSVAQVAYEDGGSESTGAGNLIPSVMKNMYPGIEVGKGIRIVRIATSFTAQSLGYGTELVKRLNEFYALNQPMRTSTQDPFIKFDLLIDHRSLVKPEFHYKYIGTSFGLTKNLLRFWTRSGFLMVHLRQSLSNLTAEHSCIMLKKVKLDDDIDNDGDRWLEDLNLEFRSKFAYLLGQSLFSKLNIDLCTSILRSGSSERRNVQHVQCFNNEDTERLRRYWKDLVDWRVITDLIRRVALEYFTSFEGHGKGKGKLTDIQSGILIGMGLQGKTLENVSKELGMGKFGQTRGLFNRTLKIVTGIGGDSQESIDRKKSMKRPLDDIEDEEREREISLRDVL